MKRRKKVDGPGTEPPSRREQAIAAYRDTQQAERDSAAEATLELQSRPESMAQKQALEDAAREWAASMGFEITFLEISWTPNYYYNAYFGASSGDLEERFDVRIKDDGSVVAHLCDDPANGQIQNEFDLGAALSRAEKHRHRFDDW